MPVDFGKPVKCACAVENEDGEEEIFFGSDDGYVYQLDSGTSFDGEEVEAYFRVPFNHLKSPRNYKRFRRVALELNNDIASLTNLSFTTDFSYGSPDIPASVDNTFEVLGGGGYWDEALWNQFYWSSQVVGEAEAYIDGSGLNMSIAIRSNQTYEDTHIIHGVLLHYSVRGLKR